VRVRARHLRAASVKAITVLETRASAYNFVHISSSGIFSFHDAINQTQISLKARARAQGAHVSQIENQAVFKAVGYALFDTQCQ